MRTNCFAWSFFFSTLAMVLYVVFTAAYEGARIGILADDPRSVMAVGEAARSVEQSVRKCPRATDEVLAGLRQRALSGNGTASRALGLLCISGRLGVGISKDDLAMSRDWALFGFAFYFGSGVFAYYILRPLWLARRRERRSCLSGLLWMLAIPFALYAPGLAVFHFARQWYPTISAWFANCAASLM